MKILFLTQVLPFPLDAGPKIRAYYVLRHLAESGHQITLVSFVREDDRPEYRVHLRQFCTDVYTVPMRRSTFRDARKLLEALLFGRPFLIVRDRVSAMLEKIRRVLSAHLPFDAIHADQLWMAPYALFARKQVSDGRPPLVVLDQHNAVFQIPLRLADAENNLLKRMLLRLEARKLFRFEKDVCNRMDRVVWVTSEDQAALYCDRRPNGSPGVKDPVIPIAVDSPSPTSLMGIGSSTRRRITFMGGLHWPPNLQGIRWFRNDIWPFVKQRLPEALLTVIGRGPSTELAGGDPSIEVTGYLTDPTTLLDETAVFIVPLLAGGGMRVKILEAWARRLPVVSTTLGAEGIEVRHRSNICLADDPGSFAEAVVELTENRELARRLSSGGLRTLESTYHWRQTYLAWNQVYSCASSFLSRTLPA